MEPEGTERRLAAILSADAVGYSRHMAEDEDATVRRITAHREQMAVLVRQHRGRVVDAKGDDLLAEFPSVTDRDLSFKVVLLLIGAIVLVLALVPGVLG